MRCCAGSREDNKLSTKAEGKSERQQEKAFVNGNIKRQQTEYGIKATHPEGELD